jgi:hypothetical protein
MDSKNEDYKNFLSAYSCENMQLGMCVRLAAECKGSQDIFTGRRAAVLSC